VPGSSRISSAVQSLRDTLREQREEVRGLHDRGLPGPQVCARLASLIDTLVFRLFDIALAELAASQTAQSVDKLRPNLAIVALGSYGRRQCAPYSDVDLMILHSSRKPDQVSALTRPLTKGIFDVGLQLGQSVRTISEAVQLAREDPVICTSMIDSRLLLGNQQLYDDFRASFAKMVERHRKSLLRTILDARTKERDEYGTTVYLLEPHVKRSRGGLRDLNLLQWLGFAEHGASDPDRLHLLGALSKFDHRRLLSARLFLLRLRNEMHFHAETNRDLLVRAEQLRVAERFGFQGGEGMLPVERLMRDYFRHTNHLWQLVRRRDASLQVISPVTRVLDPMLSKKVAGDYRIGLHKISATPAGMAKLRQDVREVLRLVRLSLDQGKPLEHSTWSALLLAVPEFPEVVATEVSDQFMELLADSAHVGEALRVLHELGYLEKIVPAMRHARCLLQFNEYHKYTVDEHCLRAVRLAAEFAHRKDTLGQAYRDVADKRILHLALLLHDLGKGYEEDHSEVGRRRAIETCELLQLDERAAADVAFLVHKHLMMSHLAFRRDTSDERLIQRFATEIGSIDRLRMLFVLTCADLAAVGPDVLNDWKVDVLADVYVRSAKFLQDAGEGWSESLVESHRRAILDQLTSQERVDDWFPRQVALLPPGYLAGRDLAEIAQTLRRFHRLDPSGTDAWCAYQKETQTIQFTAGISRGVGRGVFSSMAGALSGEGMQILAAHTDILADDLLMLRYETNDLLFPDETPPDRLDKICRTLIAAVDSDNPPRFRKRWGQDQAEASIRLTSLPNEVRIDNDSSDSCTLVEVFTFDRTGLLYKLARKLHDLSLVIRHAKIGTYLDQVVDVFYVTDREGRKITDPGHLDYIRGQMFEVINS
jgi:[protein-PII] uridylyltransferase